MPIIRGFFQLGTSFSDYFVPAPGYPRLPFEVPGPGGDQSFSVPRIQGHRRSTDGQITHAAVYDGEGDDGQCLMMWRLVPPFTPVGSDYPSHHSVVTLAYPVQLELNNTGLGGKSARIIEVGECFGAVDQQPLVARSRLAVSDGTLVLVYEPTLKREGQPYDGAATPAPGPSRVSITIPGPRPQSTPTPARHS
jgi:hypothetical protein